MNSTRKGKLRYDPFLDFFFNLCIMFYLFAQEQRFSIEHEVKRLDIMSQSSSTLTNWICRTSPLSRKTSHIDKETVQGDALRSALIPPTNGLNNYVLTGKSAWDAESEGMTGERNKHVRTWLFSSTAYKL